MRVPRGLRHGHGPQAGGVAGEPAVKRRHAPPPMASDSRTLGRISAERMIYPSYGAVSHPWGISALNDQAAAGAIMWVPGSVAFLLPVAWMVGQLLSPKGSQIIVLRRQPVVDGSVRLGSIHQGEE